MTGAYTTALSSTDDVDEIGALHNRVFDTWGERAAEQLVWKYARNPFSDRFPVATARHEGDVVGMLGMVPQRLCVRGETVEGFQVADAAVHPDHRRRGVFAALCEEMHAFADTAGAELLTGFTNEPATRGFLGHGWTRMAVGRYVYREPDIAVPESVLSPAALARAGLSAARAGVVTGLRRRTSGTAATVERFDSPPVDTLVELYSRGVPERVHAARTPEFYDWRLAEPLTGFTAYLAVDRGGEPTCGLVVSRSNGTTVLRDAVPLAGGPADHYALLVERVLERDGVDRAVALGGFPRPRALLGRGFVPSSVPALGPSARTFVTRVPGGREGVRGLDVTEPEAWSLLHVERDF